MKARYRYRFYPTDQQKQSLAQLFGYGRVVWNDALAFCQESEKLPGYNKLSARLTQIKKTEERKWLAEVSAVPLQQSLRNLDEAYRNFFNSRQGKRKGKAVGTPRFKKKSNRQTAEFTKTGFRVKDGVVYLAKIGNLKPIWSRELSYKTKVKIAKKHHKIADTRSDFLHKLSTKVVSENQAIILENLEESPHF
jgi:putative transposase